MVTSFSLYSVTDLSDPRLWLVWAGHFPLSSHERASSWCQMQVDTPRSLWPCHLFVCNVTQGSEPTCWWARRWPSACTSSHTLLARQPQRPSSSKGVPAAFPGATICVAGNGSFACESFPPAQIFPGRGWAVDRQGYSFLASHLNSFPCLSEEIPAPV